MRRLVRTWSHIWLVSAALCWPVSISGQLPPADPADVGTIEAIVQAYYSVINGPPGVPRQWRRDSTLYMPGAMFVAMRERNGKPSADIMTPEDFRRAVDKAFVAEGFVETEIGHRIERFGNVAQVRSVYETRRAADAPLLGRGVNYLLLYWDGGRWWITGAVWDDERPGNKLPDRWIGRKERAP
jgi:hypothetical protein